MIEVSKLQDEILRLQGDYDALKKQSEKISGELETAKSKMLAYMVEAKLDSFKTERGSISLNRRFQVKVPRGDALEEFFSYLEGKDKAAASALRTVNYQSLNSWYKEVLEAAGDNAPFLVIPGLEPPSCNEYLSVRAKK